MPPMLIILNQRPALQTNIDFEAYIKLITYFSTNTQG